MTVEPPLSGETRKYNVSAYRVLFILLLLTRQRSLSLGEMNQALLANEAIQQAYNSETITKYINTLRQVGCQIPRPNVREAFHYTLQRNPFAIPLSEDEIQAAQRLLARLSVLPDEALHLRYHQLLQKIAWSVREDAQERLLSESPTAGCEHGLRQRRERTARFQNLCKDAQVLAVSYHNDAAQPLQILLEPLQVLQEGGRMYLMAYDRHHYEKIKLNLDKIIAVRQLPLKCERRLRETSVIFRLVGRLATTYRPYAGETTRPDPDQPDALRVRARTDDVPTLLRRLFKYGDLCEILSPAFARQYMREQSLMLLRALEAPPPAGLDAP